MKKICCVTDRFLHQADCKHLTLMKMLLCCIGFFLGLSAPKKGRGFLRFLCIGIGAMSAIALYPDFRAVKEQVEITGCEKPVKEACQETE